MQHRQWDVVLQLQGNGTLVNVMLRLFGARAMAGYYMPEQWVAQTDLMQPYPNPMHEIVRHIGLMEFLGVPSQGYALEFALTDADRQQTQQLLNRVRIGAGLYVDIYAGGISGRRWPQHQFAQVTDALAEQGYAVVMAGSAGEEPVIDAVRQQMNQPAVSLAGQTTLRSLGALLQNSALLVSNDTGVAYLAVACQTPSVTIFTSADPAEWGPLNRSRHRVVPEQAIDSVQRVVSEATDLLTAGSDKELPGITATDKLSNIPVNQ